LALSFSCITPASLFPRLVASISWLTGLPIEWSMLLWFAFAQFLLLWSAYKLTGQCFRSERARWAGVGLLAALLTVPVAGTALIIADSYLTARSLSTPLVLMAIACFLAKRTRSACLWLLCALLIHPQMAIYGAGFGLMFAVNRNPGRENEIHGYRRVLHASPRIPSFSIVFPVWDMRRG
jgi:hypothetical protein